MDSTCGREAPDTLMSTLLAFSSIRVVYRNSYPLCRLMSSKTFAKGAFFSERVIWEYPLPLTCRQAASKIIAVSFIATNIFFNRVGWQFCNFKCIALICFGLMNKQSLPIVLGVNPN